ncbi:hypothetical protein BC962_0005 [Gillisia mitskevichiae]|uniref:Uncharacterized protein n=1 Tax=Gillisia mitskevichiae TaxID=270921 RepID=A0A495PXE0_9FLAO|nr:hypothetical protein [Gillisia mitskevichiae]RKS55051.1 hypothetical protein BC962_0005 [Gillisia mitskevichiae]
MNKFLLALLLCFSLFSCDTPKNQVNNLYELTPEKSHFIFESENIPEFLNKVDNNNSLKESDLFKSFDSQGIKYYSSLSSPANSLICLIENDSLKYDYVFITQSTNDSLKKPELKDFSVETIRTKDFNYKKIRIGKSTIYSTNLNKVEFASNSLKILKKTVDSDKQNKASSESFKKAITARSKGKTSLYINHEYSKTTITKKNKESNSPLADWSVVDLELSNNKISFNGIAITKKPSSQLLNIFQGVQQQKIEISNITPVSARGYFSFTYEDFNKLSEKLHEFKKDSILDNKTTILNYSKEAGLIFIGDDTATALTLVDPEVALSAFPIQEELKKEFRGINIYSASNSDHLNLLKPLINSGIPKYSMFLDNFLVYAEKQETLENIISSYQNTSTLAKNANFITIQEDLANSSSLLIVSKPQLSKTQRENSLILNSLDLINNIGEEYKLAATQFVSNDGFTHIHGIILNEGDSDSEDTQELKTTTLPINIKEKSYILKNHNSNELELAFQDDSNVLSLLNLDGKVLWKKKLKTQIIGEISQIDLYKNGNLQIAFTTLNKFYILDRNGKEVKPFPIEFKDDITQPLAVFDYNNTKDYRFLIVQGKELLMYDAQGKIVKGFDFKKSTTEISHAPKHIRIRNKDYIVFPEKNGKLNILSRQGKDRISIKEKIEFSESEWYENNNEFVSLSEDGELLRIDQTGKTTKKQLSSNGNLHIVANENARVILSENILTINNKEITLDFGLYSIPKIFDISGKTYIGITDTQAKKVYLFNEKAELLPNFPVYGISLIDIINSKTKNRSIMFVLGESNEVISYEF